MQQTSQLHTKKEIIKQSGTVGNSAPLSAEARQALRTLGNLALKLADGETIDQNWLTNTRQNSDSSGPYLTVTEAYGKMRIGRSKFYDLLHQRQLKTATVGSRRMVPVAEVDRYMTGRVAAGDQL